MCTHLSFLVCDLGQKEIKKTGIPGAGEKCGLIKLVKAQIVPKAISVLVATSALAHPPSLNVPSAS